MDIYKEITERIITEMEKGIIPWEKPWIASGNCVAHTTGKPYSLLNQMLLGRPGEYITFNQCQKEGGRVKKGEKSHMVVFWKWIEQEDEETGEKKEVPFLRYFNVFHIDQCEGLAAKYAQSLPQIAEDLPETKIAEDIIYEYLGREGVHMTHEEGDRAFYRPATDTVVLPIRKRSDGRWEGIYVACYKPDGTPVRRSIYGKSRTEVASQIRQTLHQIEQDEYVPPMKITVGEWIQLSF